MRNLDSVNPPFLRPSKFSCFGTGTLLLLAVISIPLAYGGAPNIPLQDNPIVISICAVLLLSVILALGSVIFRWGWKSEYYGISLLPVAGISFLAIVPFSTAILYGKAPHWVRMSILLVYAATHFVWCRKFAVLYRKIFNEENLRSIIYEEDSDAVYYMRRGDEFLLGKYYKFSQIPRDRYFVAFFATAFLMLPAMNQISTLIGIPFVHIFLIVAMLPVSWMSFGLVVRAYLIFYFYPARIRRFTGKEVYIDLVSQHKPLRRRQKPGGIDT